MCQNDNTHQESFVLNKTHEARLISQFVDCIPDEVILEEKSHVGRPAYHPRMLLKMILFAYSRQVYSGRKIVQMNQEVLPMMWLSQNTPISYKTINRFKSSQHFNKLIKKAFVYFILESVDKNLIDNTGLFVNNQKIEDEMNKQSFIWQTLIKKYNKKMNEQVVELYNEIVQEGVNVALSKETSLINQILKA